jgi:S1-C subfamily serine protease
MLPRKAACLPDDKVLAVNGKPVTTWQDMRTQLLAGGMQPVALKIQRQDAVKDYTVTPSQLIRKPVNPLSAWWRRWISSAWDRWRL